MTWDEIADEQRLAAMQLFAKKRATCTRAVCSRAYYAAYALIASRAPAGMRFPHGWSNPSHDQIYGIVDGVPGISRTAVRQAVRRLRLSRTAADYGVGQAISRSEAGQRVSDCALVFRKIAGR